MQAYEKVKQAQPYHVWDSDPWAGFSKCHAVIDRQIDRPMDWLHEWPEDLVKEFWEIWSWVEQESQKEGLSIPMGLDKAAGVEPSQEMYEWRQDKRWGDWRESQMKWITLSPDQAGAWGHKDEEMLQALGLHVRWEVDERDWGKEDRYAWLEQHTLNWLNHRRYRFWVYPSMDLVQIALEENLLKQLGCPTSMASQIHLRGWDMKKAKEVIWKSFCTRMGSLEAVEMLWVAIILAKEGLIKKGK